MGKKFIQLKCEIFSLRIFAHIWFKYWCLFCHHKFYLILPYGSVIFLYPPPPPLSVDGQSNFYSRLYSVDDDWSASETRKDYVIPPKSSTSHPFPGLIMTCVSVACRGHIGMLSFILWFISNKIEIWCKQEAKITLVARSSGIVWNKGKVVPESRQTCSRASRAVI